MLSEESTALLNKIKQCGYQVWGENMSAEIAANILNNTPEGFPFTIEISARNPTAKGTMRLRFTLIEKGKVDIDFHDKQLGNTF